MSQDATNGCEFQSYWMGEEKVNEWDVCLSRFYGMQLKFNNVMRFYWILTGVWILWFSTI